MGRRNSPVISKNDGCTCRDDCPLGAPAGMSAKQRLSTISVPARRADRGADEPALLLKRTGHRKGVYSSRETGSPRRFPARRRLSLGRASIAWPPTKVDVVRLAV